MSRVATRPINCEAANQADDDFYAAHPEFVKDGVRIPLSADDPAQAALRTEWMDSYVAYGGKVRQGGRATPVDDPVEPCECPKLEIVDRKTGAVVSGTADKIVGQKIELTVRADDGSSVSNVHWTVPGETVASYTQSRDSAVKTDLTALTSVNVDFHWIAGGSQTVQVSGTAKGCDLTASATFNVLAPTAMSMTSKTGTVQVGNPGFRGGGLFLSFGNFHDAPNNLGIAWTLETSAPAGGAGEIAGVQLTNVHRERTLNDGTVETFGSGGTDMLDTSVPYAAAVAIAASASAKWESSDSPGGSLVSGLRRRSIEDQFHLYFMYRPAGGDSIWVTIGCLAWHWKGATTRSGAPAANTWSAPTGVSNSTNPSGAATTALPLWTANIADQGWV